METTRRTFLGGLAVASLPVTAAPVIADPLLDLINAYHAGLKAYADHPPFGDYEAEMAFCRGAYDWAIDEIAAGKTPAKTCNGAIAALKLAKQENENYSNSQMVGPLVSAALAYFEGMGRAA